MTDQVMYRVNCTVGGLRLRKAIHGLGVGESAKYSLHGLIQNRAVLHSGGVILFPIKISNN